MSCDRKNERQVAYCGINNNNKTKMIITTKATTKPKMINKSQA